MSVTDPLIQIATALEGSCSKCHWAERCPCERCQRNLSDVVLYRCPDCRVPLGTLHYLALDAGIFLGTGDGRLFAKEHHWMRVLDDGTFEKAYDAEDSGRS